MKLRTYAVCGLLLLCGQAVGAQDRDPIGENLFPPELVMQHRQAIGLTDAQKNFIELELQKIQARFMDLQAQLQNEMEALAALLKKERVEEKLVLAQLDKVLKCEGEIKSAHLSVGIAIKNKLTPQQQAKLQELRAATPSPQALQKRFEAKMRQVQAGVLRWQNDGRDPSPIGEVMQQFEPLMKQGKFKEADEVLDRALKMLSDEDNGESPKPEKQGDAAPAPTFQMAAKPRVTSDELKQEIESLKVSRVAWREIAWKSCLLDGLKESRATGKPLLLWVFIDRPADDARC